MLKLIVVAALVSGCGVSAYRPNIPVPPYGTAVICPRGTEPAVWMDDIKRDTVHHRVIIVCQRPDSP